MSANKPGTDIDAVNKNAGLGPVQVHQDVLFVVTQALEFAKLSDGAYDPSIGPVVSLWGIGTDMAAVPNSEILLKLLPLVDWRNIEVNQTEGTIFLTQKGMKLDLGSIAKGYAADEMVRIIGQRGLKRALIDLGGNMVAVGSKARNQAWIIGIQDPFGQRGAYVGTLPVRNMTLVTSGIYERFFEAGGVRYHHILSTLDGYPIKNNLLSVTIMGTSSLEADALSTAVFALGFEKGKALLEKRKNTEGIFIFKDFSIRCTTGIEQDFIVRDERFSLAD